MSTRPQPRRTSWARAAGAVGAATAAIMALVAAVPAPNADPAVTIISATYRRLDDSKPGFTITAAQPVLQMPRGYTYRVTVVGHGVDLVQTIAPGSAALAISNIRRRNGLETRGPGQLLFDVAVSRQSTPFQRIPINLRYITGQTDRLSIEVHPGGRITSMSPQQVPAGQPVTVTYTGIDLSTFVLSGSDFHLQRIVERTPTRVRIEYVFPEEGPTDRYVILGSKQTTRDDIFAFIGHRPFSVMGAAPRYPKPIVSPPSYTTCVPRVGQPCP